VFYSATLPTTLWERPWISQVLNTSLHTCHGLITPLTRHNLARPVALLGLRRRYKSRQSELFIVGAIPALQEHAFPVAYIILCLRFALVVRLIVGDKQAISNTRVFALIISVQHARLDTGDWLSLTRLGLAPSKMRQALLVALTPLATADL